MKKINWLKGLMFGLLAFAFLAGSFGAVTAKAESKDTKVKVTFYVGEKESSEKKLAVEIDAVDADGDPTTTNDVTAKADYEVDVVKLAADLGYTDKWAAKIAAVEITDTTNTFKYDAIGGAPAGTKVKLIAKDTAVLADNEFFVAVQDLFTWNYDPAKDAVVVTADRNFVNPAKANGSLSIWYAEVKNGSASLKGSKFAKKAVSDGKLVISLSDKTKGVKIDNSKVVNLFVTATKPADDATSYSANVVVQPTNAKKLKVEVNYAVAAKNSNAVAISSIYTEDAGKNKATLVEPKIADPADPKAEEIKAVNEYDKVAGKLQYSIDEGKNWYYVSAFCALNGNYVDGSMDTTSLKTTIKGITGLSDDDKTAIDGLFDKLSKVYNPEEYKAFVDLFEMMATKEIVDEAFGAEYEQNFSGENLYEWMSAGKKVQFRMGGQIKYALAADKTFEAVRTSKPVKVSLKKPARAAAKIKLDAAANSLALKNGYDFAVKLTEVDAKDLAVEDYFTVLPYNKSGAVEANAIIDTEKFVPAKYSDETAGMYTTVKYKALGIDTIVAKENADREAINEANKSTTGWTDLPLIGDGQEIFIYVRKSAAAGKPAQVATKVKVNTPAAAPVVTADTKTKDGKQSVLGTGDAKGKFTSKGLDKLEFAIIDHSDITVEPENKAASAGKPAVKAGDITASKVDWTTVKWAAVSKLTTKSKTKYALTGESASNHSYSDDCYIVLRTAGQKDKAFASKPMATKIISEYTNTPAKAGEEGEVQILWVKVDWAKAD